MRKSEIVEQIVSNRLVAVIRGKSVNEAIQIIEGAVEAGMKCIELTYTTPFVQDVFNHLRETDAIIGAGTVLDAETARHAILNGAKFIVSPNFNPSIATLCNRYSIPYFPGCMTITECVTALEAGCDIVKLFPASQYEPSFLKAVQGPLPNIQIMPTGGIGIHNMNDWLQAGAVAVGIGSDLNKAYATNGKQGVKNTVQQYFETLN